MEFLTELWLPILLTAIALHFASFIAWVVLPHHQSDFSKAPNEDALLDAVRKLNLPNDRYMFPYLTHADQKDPVKIERYKKGPTGMLSVWGVPNMGRNLGLTFVYFLIIAAVTAYIGWAAMGGLGADERFMKAFQVIGAIGILVFASSGQLNAIWFKRRMLNEFLDGVVFGIIMGLIFAIFWPLAGA